MTSLAFRKLALGLPLTEESSHMDHPDFRVGGKIFATLTADGQWGTVKLTAAQQAKCLADGPEVFSPASGAWGTRGYTRVCIRLGKAKQVQVALAMAWRNAAPKRLIRELGTAN